MHITYTEIPDAFHALDGLTKRLLPISSALKIRKIYRHLQTLWEDCEEIRKKMLDTYAEKDANGQYTVDTATDTIKIAPEHLDSFAAAWRDLLTHKLELKDTLTAEDLGDEPIELENVLKLGPLLAD